ncbi:hypothetical protein [Facklamia sp. P9177]|uniref:hypothetical protein n=1 Tax=Facklamia sp. P9177 TaxID=3421945 RepID=UPI003D187441
MKRDIKKEMILAKKLSILVIIIGIFFALSAGILFIKKDVLKVFPRMDIAWIGFFVVALILCIGGIGVLFATGDKQKWINETDERERLITAASFMIGYSIQTSLLGMVFFLLTFAGYLNKVSAFSILAVILISGIVAGIYNLYLRKVE